ncbi:MAG TPA: hypothetical protein VGG03_04635 [Thermoanaerobaculia bacterium]
MTVIKSIRMIGISALAAGLCLLAAPAVARAQDSVFVSSTGDVGIGTSTPTARLDVQSNGSSSVTARFRNSNPNADVFMVLSMENANSGVNGSSSLQLGSNSSFANIQAHGSGRTLSRFGQPLASWVEIAVAGASNGLIVGTTADKPLILGTNNADRLHIKATGDIGIGTTTPASKLHVNGGDIRVSGGSFIDDGVTLNAPDYVFEPDYRLMPLDELREFVSRERHLPNVPSASDIKKEGLNLSQLQMRLLEKLEELTLYTLKQDVQIKAQQARIDELQSELEERLEALEQATAAKPEQQ